MSADRDDFEATAARYIEAIEKHDKEKFSEGFSAAKSEIMRIVQEEIARCGGLCTSKITTKINELTPAV
jgi:hypothetical protein